MAEQLYMVWPLVAGLRGLNGQGREVDLAVGFRGWMRGPEAAAAVEAGQVQLMAGADPRQFYGVKVMEPGPVFIPMADEPKEPAVPEVPQEAAPEEKPKTAESAAKRPAGRRGFYGTK
jgi:hypothetical protein